MWTNCYETRIHTDQETNKEINSKCSANTGGSVLSLFVTNWALANIRWHSPQFGWFDPSAQDSMGRSPMLVFSCLSSTYYLQLRPDECQGWWFFLTPARSQQFFNWVVDWKLPEFRRWKPREARDQTFQCLYHLSIVSFHTLVLRAWGSTPLFQSIKIGWVAYLR